MRKLKRRSKSIPIKKTKLYNGTIYTGDCREVMNVVAPGTFHCAVTSPPYWSMRDYGGDAREMGREKTVCDFLENMIDVGKGIWRLLREDGLYWFNIGDMYAQRNLKGGTLSTGLVVPDIKKQEIVNLPSITAMALRSAGWRLVAPVLWQKVTFARIPAQNHPVMNYEYIYQLAKQKDHYFDIHALSAVEKNRNYPTTTWRMGYDNEPGFQHSARFPIKLPERCIIASTSEHGVCAECGTQYERVVERKAVGKNKQRPHITYVKTYSDEERGIGIHRAAADKNVKINIRKTIGWEKKCDCDCEEVKPALVFDPFLGTGTTAVAAELLGRRWAGSELTPHFTKEAVMKIRSYKRGGTLVVERAKQKGFGLLKDKKLC